MLFSNRFWTVVPCFSVFPLSGTCGLPTCGLFFLLLCSEIPTFLPELGASVCIQRNVLTVVSPSIQCYQKSWYHWFLQGIYLRRQLPNTPVPDAVATLLLLPRSLASTGQGYVCSAKGTPQQQQELPLEGWDFCVEEGKDSVVLILQELMGFVA